MKLILSRKGFDTSSGGCPSPIMPDGRLISLPIPDKQAAFCYKDLLPTHLAGSDDAACDYAKLVRDLSRGKITGKTAVHLDPDLEAGLYPRASDWRPLLGQHGSADGHLRKQGVGPGDVFLFFGLFRAVEKVGRQWRYIPAEPARHIIWGWMQIAQIVDLTQLADDVMPWARYHAHFHGDRGKNNQLYLATEQLQLGDVNGAAKPVAGSSVFPRLTDELILTQASSTTPSLWALPHWFYPEPECGKPALSYHDNPARWQRGDNKTLCQSVARGQEFVLDMQAYPEAADWLSDLLEQA